jgi:hypothetical protein
MGTLVVMLALLQACAMVVSFTFANIRVDLLFIYPYLAFVTICAVAYFARSSRGST